MHKYKIGITQGDTNGIGLEVVVKAVASEGICDLFTPVIFANKKLLTSTINAIKGENMKFQLVSSAADARPGRINVVNIGEAPIVPTYGVATPESGAAAFASLSAACDALEAGELDAIVTAPINKQAIQSDDFNFPGHTEFLEARFAREDRHASMILFNENLRVALLTTHLPLAEVSAHVSAEAIIDKVHELNATLIRDFACERPKIAVLSLNPHCGDAGLLGSEEQTAIIPAVKALQEEEILAFGPYSADGFFAAADYLNFDAILAMYHDQGLAPFKAVAQDTGVNFTAGLDIVRTSPDHGTAYDIAGKMIADPTSMRHAMYMAVDILRSRNVFDGAAANPLPTTELKVSNKPQ